jgi:hypothetical protein
VIGRDVADPDPAELRHAQPRGRQELDEEPRAGATFDDVARRGWATERAFSRSTSRLLSFTPRTSFGSESSL